MSEPAEETFDLNKGVINTSDLSTNIYVEKVINTRNKLNLDSKDIKSPTNY